MTSLESTVSDSSLWVVLISTDAETSGAETSGGILYSKGSSSDESSNCGWDVGGMSSGFPLCFPEISSDSTCVKSITSSGAMARAFAGGSSFLCLSFCAKRRIMMFP